MKKLIIAVLAILFLAGCRESGVNLPLAKVVSVKKKEYIVMGFTRPKHFYIDLQDVETGQTYNNQYVSKHCNDYSMLIRYTKWEFTEVIYQYPDGTRVTQVEGVTDFCRRITERQYKI